MMYTVIFPIILFNKPTQTWSYLTVGIFSLNNDNIKQKILNASRRNIYEIPLCYNENQKTLEVLTCFNVVFLFHGFLVITVVRITIHHSPFTIHHSPFTISHSPFTILTQKIIYKDHIKVITEIHHTNHVHMSNLCEESLNSICLHA